MRQKSNPAVSAAPSVREAAMMALGVMRNCRATGLLNAQAWGLDAAIKTMSAALAEPDAEPSAWAIRFTGTGGVKRTHVHSHNAIGDYRAMDPDATSTPLFAGPQAAHGIKGAA